MQAAEFFGSDSLLQIDWSTSSHIKVVQHSVGNLYPPSQDFEIAGTPIRLAFADGAFDTVFNFGSLGVVSEEAVAGWLEELYRVTRRNVWIALEATSTRNQIWWEARFVEAGFRRHPLMAKIVPDPVENPDEPGVVLVLEKVAFTERGRDQANIVVASTKGVVGSAPSAAANTSAKLKGLEQRRSDLQAAKLAVEAEWRREFARLNPLNIDIRSCKGERLAKHVLDINAPWLKSPVPACSIPGMITTEEKQYYAYLTRFYSGVGRVVELGPWLGCSTWHLCTGLRQNPNFHDQKLCVVDDFTWRSSWMDSYYSAPDRPQNHEDFRFIYERHIAEHAQYIETHKARMALYDGNAAVSPFAWHSGPIEICFVDCGRNIEANEAWYSLLRPHFVEDRTLLVMQDWQTHKELPEKWWNQMKIFTDSKGEAIELLHELRDGGVATFLYRG